MGMREAWGGQLYLAKSVYRTYHLHGLRCSLPERKWLLSGLEEEVDSAKSEC